MLRMYTYILSIVLLSANQWQVVLITLFIGGVFSNSVWGDTASALMAALAHGPYFRWSLLS